jgi:alpha-tubulin suppressor-like RCC1 family protein
MFRSLFGGRSNSTTSRPTNNVTFDTSATTTTTTNSSNNNNNPPRTTTTFTTDPTSTTTRRPSQQQQQQRKFSLTRKLSQLRLSFKSASPFTNDFDDTLTTTGEPVIPSTWFYSILPSTATTTTTLAFSDDTTSTTTINNILPPHTYFIATYSTHSFALTQSGEIFGRGSNQYNLLSAENPTSTVMSQYRKLGFDVFHSKRFISVATNSKHAAAVTVDGLAFVWGAGDSSDVSSTSRTPPTQLPGPLRREKIVQVVCCEDSFSFLTEQGQIWSWASTLSAYSCKTLGRSIPPNTSTKASQVPMIIGDSLNGLFISQIFAGPYKMFAIDTNGTLFWWGVSFTTEAKIYTCPKKVEIIRNNNINTTSNTIISLSCSNNHAAIVLSSGEIFTCGGDLAKQFGELARSIPTANIQSDDFIQIEPSISTTLLLPSSSSDDDDSESNKIKLVKCGDGFTLLGNDMGQIIGFGDVHKFPSNCIESTSSSSSGIKNMYTWTLTPVGYKGIIGDIFTLDNQQLQLAALSFSTLQDYSIFSSRYYGIVNTHRRERKLLVNGIESLQTACLNMNESSVDVRTAVVDLFHISTLNGSSSLIDSNTDYVKIYSIFETLRTTMSKRPTNNKWLQERFDELFTSLKTFAPSVNHIGQLKVFWIAFLMGASDQTKLLQATLGLNDAMITELCSWFIATSIPLSSTTTTSTNTNQDTFFFSKLLRPIVKSVETSLLSRKNNEWPVGAMRLLAYLHAKLFGRSSSVDMTGSSNSNNAMMTTNNNNTSIVIPPPSSFYIHPKWDQQTLMEKWVNFLQERRKPRQNGSTGSFSALNVNAIAASSSNKDLVQSLFAYPFMVDSETKMEIIHLENSLQQQLQVAIFAAMAPTGSPYLEVQVSRERLLEDTTRIFLNARRSDLSKPMRVVFLGEPGVDMGGVKKEFFELLSHELFATGELFQLNAESGMLYLNRTSEFSHRVANENQKRLKTNKRKSAATATNNQHSIFGNDNSAAGIALAGGVMYLNENDFFGFNSRDEGILTWNTCTGHGNALVHFYTPSPNFTCDLCKRQLPENTSAWGCRQCNQDVCEDCHRKGELENARMLSITGNVEQDPIQREQSLNEEARKKVVLTGVFLGLAVYNAVLLDVHFCPVLLRALLEGATLPARMFLHDISMYDLELIDESLARGLKSLLEYNGEDFNDVFGQQNFTAANGEELIEGGEEIYVTKENRKQYVEARIRYEVRDSYIHLIEALIEGFQAVVRHGNVALEMMSVEEFELMLCGVPELDLVALRKNVRYEGGYDDNSRAVKWLWEILSTYPLEKVQTFIAFTTGTKRAPLGGLAKLTLLIQRGGPDSEQIPSSHTCFNTLLLPDYSTKEKMEAKMELALANAQGFGLR